MGEQRLKVQPSSTASSVEHRDVLLISMPFGPLYRPSLGLSLLQAGLDSRNLSSEILYFTFSLAGLISPSLYNQIAEGYPDATSLTGEWIFAEALFKRDSSDIRGYINDVLRGRSAADLDSGYHGESAVPRLKQLDEFIEGVMAAREKVEGFLDDCLRQVIERRPSLVGFTNVFQQQVASLCLAKRLKARAPETFIIFGGANCEGVMGSELMRRFAFIDAVVSGEGDIIFPEIAHRVINKESISDLQGVRSRDRKTVALVADHQANAPSVHDLNSLPYPSYDAFFRQLKAAGLAERSKARLLFETSRGCWWGEKNHCTFCGLNGATMFYRSKSAQRALDELVLLTKRHPGCDVEVVDNILDWTYFREFIPALISQRLNVELYYEVKANLKREQVRLLREAGIRKIQPGIESLSTHTLKLMRKGVSRLQNIQLLKWCKEFGVEPFWNLLWGFPGELPEEYARMAELIPLITHLKPPESAGSLRLDRFSPLFDKADEFGLMNIKPCPAYQHIYPFPPESLANLAYYFTFDYRSEQNVEHYTRPLAEQVLEWKAVHGASDLFSKDFGTFLLICDLRPVALKRITVLTGLQRELYLLCHTASTISEIKRTIELRSGESASEQQITELFQPLIESHLLIQDECTFLNLAIPLGIYAPKRSTLEAHELV